LEAVARWQGAGKPADDISVLAVEVSVASGSMRAAALRTGNRPGRANEDAVE
jgi:hypothetical protein